MSSKGQKSVGDDNKDRRADRLLKPAAGDPLNVVDPDRARVLDVVPLFIQRSFLFQTVVGPSTAGDIHAADVKSLSAIDMR
jgi:hypothetical protein